MLSVNSRPSLPNRAALKRAVAVTVLAGVGAGLPLIAATGASAAPLHPAGHGHHHHAAGQGYTGHWAATQQAPAQQAPVQQAPAAPAAAPAAAQTAAPAPAAAPASYTVQSGDWLSKIATSHNVQGGWQKLYDLNKGTLNQGPNVLFPGQHLVLGDAQAAPAQAPAATQAPAPAAPAAAPVAAAPVAAAPVAAPVATVDVNSPSSLQALAASIVPADQLASFDQIITHESGWDVTATNPSSGAYGLPQALPGNKMASAGSDWATNPATQIKWALQYMNTTYGSPNQAWAFWQVHQAY
ncbi:LysM peptidoglycan-binding domain-containing protein [Kitasatospora sp. NBC_01266]|uniref:LysM peptidoglycan-binding domain-containing protein n=1 Tax=Kitasatospora sp. NBC_01266 TaxID=2903572 RepID=UPI002E2FCC65|nr:LysM peptidoglycan-binding domain-containing protein [Kitasatospora sp. NBC_01266]